MTVAAEGTVTVEGLREIAGLLFRGCPIQVRPEFLYRAADELEKEMTDRNPTVDPSARGDIARLKDDVLALAANLENYIRNADRQMERFLREQASMVSDIANLQSAEEGESESVSVLFGRTNDIRAEVAELRKDIKALSIQFQGYAKETTGRLDVLKGPAGPRKDTLRGHWDRTTAAQACRAGERLKTTLERAGEDYLIDMGSLTNGEAKLMAPSSEELKSALRSIVVRVFGIGV